MERRHFTDKSRILLQLLHAICVVLEPKDLDESKFVTLF